MVKWKGYRGKREVERGDKLKGKMGGKKGREKKKGGKRKREATTIWKPCSFHFS
jgi:hypothetical protein